MLTAIDYAIDMGLADPSKLTVLGGSHGGFLTTHLIGQVQQVFKHFFCLPNGAPNQEFSIFLAEIFNRRRINL